MMRNISPRAHAHAQAALPSRDTSSARNMTGIFLGTDDSKAYPKARHIIPPLARCRALNKRSRTPTEERRYKLVELLRYKEERRGFSGNPIKRRAATTAIPTTPSPLPPQYPQEDVEIWDITRQTQRHFTAATNSGVTHLEYLNRDVDGCVTSLEREAFVQEVHRAASGRQPSAASGLAECYKTVCKGNVESLQHLLPTKALRTPSTAPNSGNQSFRYTGFTVKSYRNPNQAEIAASFEPPLEQLRPRTVGRAPATSSGSRPFVPSPFFYKSPSRSGQRGPVGSPRQGFNESPLSPIPGVLSRSITRGRATSTLSQEVLHGSSYTNKVPPAVPRSTPAPKSAKSGTTSSPESEAGGIQRSVAEDPSVEINVPGGSSDLEAEAETSTGAMSGTDIVIGLEDEQGEQRPVEIDEADELLTSSPQAGQEEDEEEEEKQAKRRVSITDRVLRNKNCELQMKEIEETAKTRKNELAELLNEHAQIVQEVVTMVKSSSERSLAGKENSMEPTTDGASDETTDE